MTNPARKMNHYRARVGIFIYSVYLLIVTFHPFELSLDFAHSLSHAAFGFETFVVNGWNWLGPKDFLLNIMLFLPCGVLLYSLWEDPRRSTIATITLVTVAGGIASFLIEFAQVFALRNSSVIDVASNTLGSAVGAFAYSLYSSRDLRSLDGLVIKFLHSKVALCCALAYAALPVAFSFEQSRAPFWRWDPQLTLQLGNEPTMNRPWRGKIYLVALYRRALSAQEIAGNFAAGYSAAAPASRIQSDLIALYTFSEGVGNKVHDSSSFGPALNLQFSPGPRIRWLTDSNGIELTRRSIVKSQGPATKLAEAVRATDELTVELWMTPQKTEQRGPARIISLSRGSGARNFMLGQEGADIHFRLRTPVSGNNGAPVLLRTNHGILRADDFHIVTTYKGGIQRLYVNGAERPEKLNLATDGIVGFSTRKTPVAQIAFCFFYFFPLSVVLSVFFLVRMRRSEAALLISVAVIVGLAMITELFQALTLVRPLDIAPVGYALIVGALGGLSGRALMGARS